MNSLKLFFNYEISWIDINRLLIFTIFLTNITSFFIFPNTDLYNSSTLIINSIFCIILIGSLSTSKRALFIFGSVISVISYIFIFPRVLINLVLPNSIQYPWYQIIGVTNFNNSYLYIVTSVLFILIGVYVSSAFIKKSAQGKIYSFENLQKKTDHHIFYTSCIFFIIVVVVNLGFNYSIYNFEQKIRNDRILAIITFLFSASLAANCGIFYLKRISGSFKNANFYILIISTIYLLVCILLGSRSGPITLVYMLITTKIIIDGNFKITIKKYIIYFNGFIFISLLSFYVGTEFRNSIMGENPVYAQAQKNEAEQKLQEALNEGKFIKKNEGKLNYHFDDGTEKILTRLFFPFDLSILGIVLERDDDYQKKFMNMQYMIKSGINIVVPGVIFEEAKLNTALLWPFLYKIRDKEVLNNPNYYETFGWGLWSVLYVMYGLYSSLIIIFILGIIWGLLYYKISSLKNKEIFISYFVFILFPLFFMAGIDDYLSWSLQIFISLFVYILIKKIISLLIK